MGPLNALRRQRPSLELVLAQNLDWSVMSSVDAVFLQRPYGETQVAIAQFTKKLGLPLWIDHDDNLFSVPTGNPMNGIFAGPSVHARVARVCGLADIMTVSTPEMADRFAPLCRGKTFVVPNALMTNMIGHIPNHEGATRTHAVMWRGSQTHQRDIDRYTLPIKQAAEQHPDLLWLWFGLGEANYRLLEMVPKSRVAKGVDPIDYFGAISKTLPKIVLVPLAENAFNRCKSNIAWIEAIYCGALCIAPDWPTWRRPGCFNYTDGDSMRVLIQELLALSPEQHDEQWRAGRQHIEKLLTIDTVNSIRSEVVSQLEALSGNDDFRNNTRASMYANIEAVTE